MPQTPSPSPLAVLLPALLAGASPAAAQLGPLPGLPAAALGQPGGALMQGGAGPVDTNTVRGRANAARAGDTFNPRDYGAVGDGNPHTAASALGVSGLAGLAGWTASDGSHPYAWVNAYPAGTLFNLPASAVSPAGGSTLTFGASQATGSAAAAGSRTLALADVGGLAQGMSVTAVGVAAGTQVEWVNPSTLAIGLSAATTASIPAGTGIAFGQPWLSRVAAGMAVSGPGVPAGAVVAAVGANAVALSVPLTAATVAPSANTAAAPQYQGTAITFYAPFTDAQAAGLQMDALGLQAAVKAAEAAGGGRVVLPAGVPGGKYLVDQTIEFVTGGTAGTTLEGDGTAGSQISVPADLGPSRYALSCGDPTATAANQRGIYATGGSFCFGEWRGFTLTGPGTIPFLGARPQSNGVPVAMGGVKQGPRRNMRYVGVTGFNVGIQFQGDWTTDDYVSSGGNFTGVRFDDGIANLFGDNRYEQVFFGGNSFADISVAPGSAILSSRFSKSWIADAPYEIWFEPGLPAYSGASLFATVFDSVNFEGAGCGSIVDGNVKPDGSGKVRGVQTVSVRDSVMAGGTSYPLAAGCPWHAYLDLGFAYDLTVSEPAGNGLAPVAGGTAMIRVDRVLDYAANGGIRLVGAALPAIFDAYAALNQEIVASSPTDNSMTNNNSSTAVEFDIPGIGRLKQYWVGPANGAVLTKGTLMEANSYFNLMYAQPSGTAAAGTAPLLGTVYSTYTGSMLGKYIPIMVEGQRIPIAVSGAPSVPSLLQLDTANSGRATTAATITTGRVVGFVTDRNGGSASQVFMQGQFGQGGP